MGGIIKHPERCRFFTLRRYSVMILTPLLMWEKAEPWCRRTTYNLGLSGAVSASRRSWRLLTSNDAKSKQLIRQTSMDS